MASSSVLCCAGGPAALPVSRTGEWVRRKQDAEGMGQGSGGGGGGGGGGDVCYEAQKEGRKEGGWAGGVGAG